MFIKLIFENELVYCENNIYSFILFKTNIYYSFSSYIFFINDLTIVNFPGQFSFTIICYFHNHFLIRKKCTVLMI